MDLKPKKFQFPISGAFRQMLHSAQKRKKGGGKKKKESNVTFDMVRDIT